MSRRIKLTLGYDGGAYAGWQRQNNGLGVQEVLENTLDALFHEGTRVQGSGRTDAGVHARGQVAAFDLAHPIPLRQLILALNATLPEDVRIYEAEEVKAGFNPQFDAKTKTYRYRFYDGEVLPPEWRRIAALSGSSFSSEYGYTVDWDLFEEIGQAFVGEHDFACCCASGSSAVTTVRTVTQLKLLREEEGPHVMTLEISGNGFLYNMVRIIAGTLLEAGKRNISREIIEEALQSGRRELLGPTAPAKGLMLWSVCYEEQ